MKFGSRYGFLHFDPFDPTLDKRVLSKTDSFRCYSSLSFISSKSLSDSSSKHIHEGIRWDHAFLRGSFPPPPFDWLRKKKRKKKFVCGDRSQQKRRKGTRVLENARYSLNFSSNFESNRCQTVSIFNRISLSIKSLLWMMYVHHTFLLPSILLVMFPHEKLFVRTFWDKNESTNEQYPAL